MKAWSERQIKINAQVIADQLLTEANDKKRKQIEEATQEYLDATEEGVDNTPD